MTAASMIRSEAPKVVASPISERWRSSTARLILVYGAFFLAWTVLLVAMINWQTYRYLEHVVDEILEQRIAYLSTLDRDKLPGALAVTAAIDLRGVMSFGLFDADGRYVAGNIDKPPPELPADGNIHPLADGIVRVDGGHTGPSRGVSVRIADGSRIVLTRTTNVIDRVGVIIRNGFFWALSLTLIPGLVGGLLLARRPLKRVRTIETAVAPIMRGSLNARLPISERRDEVDMLSSIVNRMLDRIETLLEEVKGVSDNIAHDLRTPLTRLRASIYRTSQSLEDASPHRAALDHALTQTDLLLARFRALSRISEIESRRRRAGFSPTPLEPIVRKLVELYAPLAGQGGARLVLDVAVSPTVVCDGELLFEAIGNLLDNAIKFTPPGGLIRVELGGTPAEPAVSVSDSGPGIAPDQRKSVLQRFYRADEARNVPGSGLGLSLVDAIVRLHGFAFALDEAAEGGTRACISCWRQESVL